MTIITYPSFYNARVFTFLFFISRRNDNIIVLILKTRRTRAYTEVSKTVYLYKVCVVLSEYVNNMQHRIQTDRLSRVRSERI